MPKFVMKRLSRSPFPVPKATLSGASITPRTVGLAMVGPYALGIELASMLLLVALVAVQHLGRGEEAGAAFGAEIDAPGEPEIVASGDEPLGEHVGRGTP